MCCENQLEALDVIIKAMYRKDWEYVYTHVHHLQDINAIGSRKEALLHAAVGFENYAFLDMLFSLGADINVKTTGSCTWTPLQMAVSYASEHFERNTGDSFGPFEWSDYHLDMVEYLLKHHPDLTVENNYGPIENLWYGPDHALYLLLEAERKWQQENPNFASPYPHCSLPVWYPLIGPLE